MYNSIVIITQTIIIETVQVCETYLFTIYTQKYNSRSVRNKTPAQSVYMQRDYILHTHFSTALNEINTFNWLSLHDIYCT